jgi:G:T/U-mismatch repair DNA glycosylase
MYNISFTNYVQRATRTEKGITAQELGVGKQRLIGNIEQFTPRSICFMGKKCCQHFLYRRNVDFVFIDNFMGFPIFCLPSSSGRAGSITETEKRRYEMHAIVYKLVTYEYISYRYWAEFAQFLQEHGILAAN